MISEKKNFIFLLFASRNFLLSVEYYLPKLYTLDYSQYP